MRRRLSTILVAAGAVTLATAGFADAATYLLSYSDAFGTGDYGTVDVTGSSSDLHFVVTLDSPYELIDTGSHYAFAMHLGGSGFALAGLTPQQFTLSTGSISSSPFGGFNLGLNCIACGPGASSPWGSSLTFDITGSNLSVLAANSYHDHTIEFAADVVGAHGLTGTVGGGTLLTAVPEPAAWALMILGFGGVGAMLRHRRRQTAFTPA